MRAVPIRKPLISQIDSFAFKRTLSCQLAGVGRVSNVVEMFNNMRAFKNCGLCGCTKIRYRYGGVVDHQ